MSSRQRLDPLKTAPDGAAALLNVEKYIQASGLDHRLAMLMKMRASQINGCTYCLNMHSRELRKMGETEERIYVLDGWRESSLYSPRERAALAWTEAITRIAETRAPDADYEELRRHFSDKEIADLTLVVGMINLWNRLSIGLRVEYPAQPAKAA